MAEREILFAGACGAFADDREAAALNERIVNSMLPVLAELAESIGWAPVLNALHTILLNVGIREQGLAQIKAAHESALASLPRLAALVAAEQTAGGHA